jgi:hypothetical protein
VKKEVAQLMFKLAFSKKNWGAKYDRLEHYKRFPNLKKIVKELSKKDWILVKCKSNYTGISLNAKYKEKIIEFIEENMKEVKGMMR